MGTFHTYKNAVSKSFLFRKALNRLNIDYQKNISSQSPNPNLIITQSNGYDLEFSWNSQEYELIADISFWQQTYPVETFMDQIAQQYAGEVVIGESQKLGFQPIKYEQNTDGSNTLILERWNS